MLNRLENVRHSHSLLALHGSKIGITSQNERANYAICYMSKMSKRNTSTVTDNKLRNRGFGSIMASL